MADRQTGITAVFTADLKKLREDWEAFRKEVASRPIRVPLEADKGGAGTPGTQVSGTFGGTAHGITGVGPTAVERLDAMSIARTSGASLVMNNGTVGHLYGMPGAVYGGATSIAGQPSANLQQAAGEIVQRHADARMQKEPAGGGDFPNATSQEILTRWSDGRRVLPESRPTPSTDDDGWRHGAPRTALDRMANRLEDARVAAINTRGSADEHAYAQQYDQLMEQAVAARIAEGPMVRPPRGPGQFDDLIGTLGGGIGLAGGIMLAANSVSNSLGALSRLPFVGQNPTGSTASLALRNQIERENIAREAVAALPSGAFFNGLTDFTSATGNFLIGNGFISRQAKLERDASLAEVTSQTTGQNIATFYARQGAFTFSTRERIEAERAGALASSEYEIRHDALMTEGGDPTKLNQAGQDRLKAEQYRIDSDYQAKLLQYGRNLGQLNTQNSFAALGATQTGNREFYAAGMTQIAAGRQAEIFALGDKPDSAAVAGINAKFDALRETLVKQDAFAATQATILAKGATEAASLSAGGQNLAASLAAISPDRDASIAALDPSSPNYQQRVDAINRQANAKRVSLVGQFNLQNNQAATMGYGQAAGANLMMSGFTAAGQRAQLDAQFAANTQGFDWGTTEWTKDEQTGQWLAPTRNAAMARYGAMYQGYLAEQRGIAIDERRQRLATTSFVNSANYRLSDNPLQAQLEESRGQFQQEAGDAKAGSPVYDQAAARWRSRDALINQSFAYTLRDVRIQQQYRGQAQDRQWNFDSTGAEISGMVASTLQEGQGLWRAGMKLQAEVARNQGKRDLEIAERQYRFRFEGREIDAFAGNFLSPSQRANPSQVFEEFAQGQREIDAFKFGPGGKPPGQTSNLDPMAITGGVTLAQLKQEIINVLRTAAGQAQ